MRIIVSGSRDWEGAWAENKIGLVLGAANLLAMALIDGPAQLAVVHGACPTGADQIADQWAIQNAYAGVTVDRYPADWERLGKRAGPLRNQQMIAKGADMVFGFRRNNSTGTGHLLSLARNAGILTYEIPWPEGPPFGDEEYAELARQYRNTGGRTPNADERAAVQSALLENRRRNDS